MSEENPTPREIAGIAGTFADTELFDLQETLRRLLGEDRGGHGLVGAARDSRDEELLRLAEAAASSLAITVELLRRVSRRSQVVGCALGDDPGDH